MSGPPSAQPPPPPPAPAPEAAIAGERHVSAVAGRGGITRTQGVVLVAAATGAALAFVLLHPQGDGSAGNRQPDDRLRAQAVVRYEPPPPPPPPATPASFPSPRPPFTPPPAPAQQTVVPQFLQQPPPDPLAKARRAPILAYGSNGPLAGPNGGPDPASDAGDGTGSELAARLRPTQVSAVAAAVLPNQPYLVTKGNLFPCVLQTAMDSTLPGLVTCKLPEDVRGKTGITLLDRGTLVVGETQGNMQQGQARLFVLWTRAETPNGVVIDLASPAADPLGRTGFDGEVDTHFWARLGGALLLSVVQGALQTGVAAASPKGSTNINTGAVDSVAAESLRNSVNIRPTLRKNQGELVSIFVARDLDFSPVYGVATRAGQASR